MSEQNNVANALENIAEIKKQSRKEKNDPKQIREVIPFRDWVDSSYYAGPIASSIYTFWKEGLIEFFEGDYNEIIADGGKGSGKSFCSMVAMMYKVYQLSCYKYPQRLLGLADSSDITFAYFNVKSSLARSTGYSEIRGFIEETPYFQEKFPYNPEYKREIQLPNEIYIKYGSTESAVKGDNVLVGVTDEANFYQKGGSGSMGDVQRIRGIANDLIERRKTRFQSQGHDPGFIGIISSSTHANSYIEERKKKAGSKVLHLKGVSYLVRPWEHAEDEYATEEDYPKWDDLPDERKFWIFKGGEEKQPEIVHDVDTLERIIKQLNEFIELEGKTVAETIHNLPEGIRDRFISAPVDLKKQFEDDLISSLQGIAGVAVGTKGDFFNSDDVWDQCVSESLPFAFNNKQPVISTGDSISLDEYFREDVILNKINGYFEPKINPGAKRYLHIDLSSTQDPTGMAMNHISGHKDDRPIITFDLIIRLMPPKAPHRLSHEKIQKFVKKLKYEYSYNIEKIGMDRYSSETNLQWFEKHIFGNNKNKDNKKAVYQSTDSDDEMWIDFSSYLYANCIRMSEYDLFRQEFFELVHDRENRKVDHPDEFTDGTTGHNDISCAVVGSANLAMNSEESFVNRSDETDLIDIEDGSQHDEIPPHIQERVNGQSRENRRQQYKDQLSDDLIDLM